MVLFLFCSFTHTRPTTCHDCDDDDIIIWFIRGFRFNWWWFINSRYSTKREGRETRRRIKKMTLHRVSEWVCRLHKEQLTWELLDWYPAHFLTQFLDTLTWKQAINQSSSIRTHPPPLKPLFEQNEKKSSQTHLDNNNIDQ